MLGFLSCPARGPEAIVFHESGDVMVSSISSAGSLSRKKPL